MEKTLRVLRFDLFTCWKIVTILLGYFFVFGTYYAVSISNLLLIPISIMIWVTMLAGFPYSLRDKYGLDKLLATFPINRRTIIRSRFLFSLAIAALGIVMSEIMVCLSAGIFHIGFDIKEMYFTLCGGFLVYCLVLTIHMPLYFCFTHTKAVQASPLILYFSYIIGYQLYYSGIIDINIEPVIRATGSFPLLTLTGTLLLAAVMLFLSYSITCKVYLNKDL